MYNFNQNVHVCVAKEMCRKIYVKYTTKEGITSADLLYQNAYDMYHILQTMKTNIYVHHVIKDLQETSNENPVLPYYGKYPHAVAGTNFLKALNKRPEYVCTCCHHMLFCKTVRLFHTTDYNMTDETVKQCLSHRYVMTLHKHTSQVNDEMRTHEWPQFVQEVVEHHDIDTMDEYICIRCKNGLKQK